MFKRVRTEHVVKELDSVTAGAIALLLGSHCYIDLPGGSLRLQNFCSRAGMRESFDQDWWWSFHRSPNPPQHLADQLNGSEDFERLILRLASPKEHAGEQQAITHVTQQLNQSLWPEGLRITFDGVEPRLGEFVRKDPSPEFQNDTQEVIGSKASATQVVMDDRVFIIHGRDIGTKDTVARFIGDLGLRPIVLQELPNGGRTIIEKFEDYAQTRFAIAIFTLDDEGSLASEPGNPRPRSRQNVIFEFGYFIGKLGRDRACALIKAEIEIPSDYDGVLYIPLDDTDHWKVQLIRELQHAGYAVDANVLTRR